MQSWTGNLQQVFTLMLLPVRGNATTPYPRVVFLVRQAIFELTNKTYFENDPFMERTFFSCLRLEYNPIHLPIGLRQPDSRLKSYCFFFLFLVFCSLISLALCAKENNFVCPQLTTSSVLNIEQGR